MRTILLVLVCVVLMVGCKNTISDNKNAGTDTTVKEAVEVTRDSVLITADKSLLNEETIDTSISSSDTILIKNKKYIVQLRNNYQFCITCNKDTLFKEADYFGYDITPMDFNEDGFKDIKVSFPTNTPGMEDLFLYDSKTERFKKVDDYKAVPDAKKIKGTHYYYSYHKSGCADMNWDSDLFYIKDFKVKIIGNIHGVGCESDTTGIFIYKIVNEEKKLVKTFNISQLANYEDYKWGFIANYWTNNYNMFE